jgi:hypothetical protein
MEHFASLDELMNVDIADFFLVNKKINNGTDKICWDFSRDSLDRVSNSVSDAGTEFETRSQVFFMFVYYIKNKAQQLVD